jgi:serine/threonine protein kinase
VQLAADLARALAHLHSRRPAVIHRDIKPANCLLDRAWRLKLCDFGLAANSRAQEGAGGRSWRRLLRCLSFVRHASPAGWDRPGPL